jgi:glycosyltransferase involved in cell wall biosynthesis
MWAVLQQHIARIPVIVWVHGAEIQPWHRRDFNHQTEGQREIAKRQSDKRLAFWRELLRTTPANLKLVFVSRYFAEEVMEDLGFRIPQAQYTIIHNPINTELFCYENKPVEQRKKVLSISSYSSRKYANDLNVKAIEFLSIKPWFYDMEFRLIGDGPLFENTVAPLRKYKNVHIEQRFLKHDEISALHKEYGIFLCPTRWDSHGVSRDEAMSSGLVPVTNAVSAIPEFVDDSCGILALGDDAEAMARGIARLYEQPLTFSAMSQAAAKRVRDQRDAKKVIGAELAVVLNNSEQTTREQEEVASSYLMPQLSLCKKLLDDESAIARFECKDLSGGLIQPAETTAASSLRPRQVFRSDTRWGRSVMEWGSIDAFLGAAEVESGVHSIPIGMFAGKQINYDFLVTARPGTVLLCYFHGNAPRNRCNPPLFAGLGVTSSIETSRFIPSDPMLVLDANLTLAWHFGCEGIRLQAITVSIVEKLRMILRASRVVAWGGSGGGFAAIRVAKDIPDSIALPWNPQTNIAKYSRDSVSHYRRIAFPTMPEDGIFPSGRGQFPSFCTEEFLDGYKGTILYLQESTDWHVGAHLKPFLASFCGKAGSGIAGSSNFSGLVTDQLYLHLDHWGNGHVPPGKDVISKILGLLSGVTTNTGNLENISGFPREATDYIASTLSKHPSAMDISGKAGSAQPGSASTHDSP